MNTEDVKPLAKLLGLTKGIFEISRGRLEMKFEYVCDIQRGSCKYLVYFWDIIGDNRFTLEKETAEEIYEEAMDMIHEDYAYMMFVCGEPCAFSYDEYERIFEDFSFLENTSCCMRRMRLLFNADATSAYVDVILDDKLCPVQVLIKEESGWLNDFVKEEFAKEIGDINPFLDERKDIVTHPELNQEKLNALIKQGTKDYADVPDITAYVEDMRGSLK